MCDTQSKIIKTFTQESLDKCTEIMMENFDKIKKDLLGKLSDGIRLDIFDKLNGTNCEYKIYDFEDIKKEYIKNISNYQPFNGLNVKTRIDNLLSDGINKMKEIRILKHNEHYVHFINHYRCINRTNGHPLGTRSDIVIILGTLTNFSNFTWIEIKEKMGASDTRRDNATLEHKIYDLNTPLHNIYINILNTIKSLSSPIPPDGYAYGINEINFDHYNNNCIIFYKEIYDLCVKILDINKKYSIKMLVELDLQQKYDTLLSEKEDLNTTNSLLKEKIIKLENQLKDSIPEEHRCCICFGFTDKKKLCVPCGHAQYCNKCIDELSECALCRISVTSVVKLFI
jgi:hypothetical protein